ncbi:MAG TPA: response regulator [Bryobacteraceae bacterium]|nr:response regulator [Bryobacteraceae bacterium]
MIPTQEEGSKATGLILVVDDEPPLLKMMSVYLKRLGHSVVTADTTEQALAAAESAQPQFAAAVLDASMEGLSMQDLAMRLLKGNSAIRVIATSGYPVDMAAMEAAAPGRVMFLPKPFSPEMLASAVRRMLADQEEAL